MSSPFRSTYGPAKRGDILEADAVVLRLDSVARAVDNLQEPQPQDDSRKSDKDEEGHYLQRGGCKYPLTQVQILIPSKSVYPFIISTTNPHVSCNPLIISLLKRLRKWKKNGERIPVSTAEAPNRMNSKNELGISKEKTRSSKRRRSAFR